MLFTQLNGLSAQPAESQTEVGVLQDLACRIGPRVDGINAARSLPQAMGAFVTAGAQGACVGRDQQSEQHMPTTMYGLGADMAVAPATTAPTTPTTTTTQFSKLLALRTATALPLTKLTAVAEKPPIPGQPDLTPAAPGAPGTSTTLPGEPTYPPGTIAAFSAKNNLWRVAVPAGTQPTGLGIFSGAATFTEVAPVASPPAGGTQVTEKVLEDKTGQTPFYKKPLFWAAVAGGVVIIGGGGYWLVRRKRHAA